MSSLTIPEGRSPKSRCPQGHAPSRGVTLRTNLVPTFSELVGSSGNCCRDQRDDGMEVAAIRFTLFFGSVVFLAHTVTSVWKGWTVSIQSAVEACKPPKLCVLTCVQKS